ncbi:MAG TPA: DNA alkylation repair protein [Bacilli bacterium]|nr:DNA alkylation repair protein [Bacilli bacterium]
MWYENLFTELEKLKDNEQSIKMAQYMQNKFNFLGILKPKLTEFVKPYLKESKKYPLDWNFVDLCWNKDYREAQYICISYLAQNTKYLKKEDLDKIKKLIITKSWWETADSLDAFVGKIVLDNKELEEVMIKWSTDDNMWLRRVSIDFQQEYKNDTNTELFEKIIVNNFGTSEFFINKAIGWSLRDYSKINSTWVKEFIDKYNDKMDKLSIKEASKYL